MPTAGENPLLGSFAEAGGESRGHQVHITTGAVNYTYSYGLNFKMSPIKVFEFVKVMYKINFFVRGALL